MGCSPLSVVGHILSLILWWLKPLREQVRVCSIVRKSKRKKEGKPHAGSLIPRPLSCAIPHN